MNHRYFINIKDIENPQRDHLHLFVDESVNLLKCLVTSEDFLPWLWKNDERLRGLAKKTLTEDVYPASDELKEAIAKIPEDRLKHHGLVGSAARFKYAVLVKTSKSWRRSRGWWTVGAGFRSVLEAMDAILDSLIAATGTGAGGLIKEFKDAIMALVRIR